MIFIVGASGTGKSSLINALNHKKKCLDMDFAINTKKKYTVDEAIEVYERIFQRKYYEIISCPPTASFIEGLVFLQSKNRLPKNSKILHLNYHNNEIWKKRLLRLTAHGVKRDLTEVKVILNSNPSKFLESFHLPIIFVDQISTEKLSVIILQLLG